MQGKMSDLIKPSADFMRELGVNFEEPLTLDKVIEIGLYNNLELRISEFEKQIADKETVAEKLKMLPSLRASGTWSRRDVLRKSDVYNWQTDEDQEDYTVSELQEGSKGDLVLTWNVLDTAMAYVKSNQLDMKEQILQKRKERQAHQLILELTEAYWQAAAVEDALDDVHNVERDVEKD